MLQLYVHYLQVLVDYFSGNLGGASRRSHDPLDAVVDEEPAVDDLCIFSVLPATSSDFFSKMSVDLLSTVAYWGFHSLLVQSSSCSSPLVTSHCLQQLLYGPKRSGRKTSTTGTDPCWEIS